MPAAPRMKPSLLSPAATSQLSLLPSPPLSLWLWLLWPAFRSWTEFKLPLASGSLSMLSSLHAPPHPLHLLNYAHQPSFTLNITFRRKHPQCPGHSVSVNISAAPRSPLYCSCLGSVLHTIGVIGVGGAASHFLLVSLFFIFMSLV